MDYLQPLMIAKELAKKAGVPFDKYIDAVTTHQEYQMEQEKKRSASPEDKEKILAYLGTLDGNISEDLPPSEICAAAGVSRKQGTMSYARYQVRQLLLEHKK
jgi:hypothetical protein